MRFFPLLALTAIAPAFALESRELSGDWSCSTSYPALSARLEAGLLHYDVHSKDRWSLQDKALTIDIADYTIARAFKPRMVEILAESPELTAYEEKLFASLKHGGENNRVQLTIVSHDGKSLQMRDGHGNVSECQRM